jgi:hypothetical protein
MGVAGQRRFPFILPHGNNPTIHCTGDYVGPIADWTDEEQKKIQCAHRGSITVLPSLQRPNIPTTLPRLLCLYVPQNPLLPEGYLLGNTCSETSLPLPALYKWSSHIFLHLCNLFNTNVFQFLTYVLKQVYVKILPMSQVLITALCIFLLSSSLYVLFSLQYFTIQISDVLCTFLIFTLKL